MSSTQNSVRDIDQQFWSSANIPHLVIRCTHNSSVAYKAHSHSELSIGIIESGSTCPTINEKDILLHTGDIILIEPDIVHACNPVDGKPRSYYMLYLDSDWCCNILSCVYARQVQAFVCEQHLLSDERVSRELLYLVNQLLGCDSDDVVLALNKLLFNLVVQYCSPLSDSEADNDLAYQIREKLLTDIVSPPSISEIAQELQRSQESIIRAFKRQFGITPRAFLNNQRIEKAKLLLKQGMDIVNVALEVGYSDQSQMHHAFVKYTAATPKQYQQLASISDNK